MVLILTLTLETQVLDIFQIWMVLALFPVMLSKITFYEVIYLWEPKKVVSFDSFTNRKMITTLMFYYKA